MKNDRNLLYMILAVPAIIYLTLRYGTTIAITVVMLSIMIYLALENISRN